MGKGASLVCCGSGAVRPLTGFGHDQVFLVVVAGVDACRVTLVVGVDARGDVHGLSRPFRIEDSLAPLLDPRGLFPQDDFVRWLLQRPTGLACALVWGRLR